MNWLGSGLKKTAVGLLAAATLASVGAVTTVGTALAATQAMVATGNVNLRSGPGTAYKIIGVVRTGASVTATGVTSGPWVQVTYGTLTGYVSGSYVKASGTATTPPATTAPPATTTPPAPAPTGTATTTGSVNVRSGPGTSYAIVAVAAAGTVVNTTGVTSGSWTQVVWSGTVRWISTSYLRAGGSSGTGSTTPPPATPSVVGQVRTTTNVNMRAAGNSSATILGQLPANTVVDVTGQTTSTYTQIVYGGRAVWIYSAYTAPVTANPVVSTASARVQTVLDYARAQVGKKYVWGGAGPSSFDCSGLTMAAYAQVGIALPHHAADQARMGTAVSRANLVAGDLIFWYSPVGHVSLYIGDGQMIHARGTAYGVVQQSVDAYIAAGGTYTSARRFIS